MGIWVAHVFWDSDPPKIVAVPLKLQNFKTNGRDINYLQTILNEVKDLAHGELGMPLELAMRQTHVPKQLEETQHGYELELGTLRWTSKFGGSRFMSLL